MSSKLKNNELDHWTRLITYAIHDVLIAYSIHDVKYVNKSYEMIKKIWKVHEFSHEVRIINLHSYSIFISIKPIKRNKWILYFTGKRKCNDK